MPAADVADGQILPLPRSALAPPSLVPLRCKRLKPRLGVEPLAVAALR